MLMIAAIDNRMFFILLSYKLFFEIHRRVVAIIVKFSFITQPTMLHHFTKKSYFLICLIISFYQYSCVQCDGSFVTDGYIKLDLVDSNSGGSLLSLTNPIINKNDVRVRSTNGDTLRYYFALINGAGSDRDALYINVLNYGDLLNRPSFQSEQCKNILVSLSSTREFQLKVCFLSRDGKCGSYFRTLELFYQGKRIASDKNTLELSAVIKN